MTGAEIAAGIGALAAVGSAGYGIIQGEEMKDKAKDNAPVPVTRDDPLAAEAARRRRAARAAATGLGDTRLTGPVGRTAGAGKTDVVGQIG